MPKADQDNKVTQCLLDRLMEVDPRMNPDRQLKASLRRDLEWLLNTRRIVDPPPESLVELNRSVYLYGLPDFSSYSLAAPKDRGRS